MANSRFNPLYSSDEIWLGNQTNRCLTDELDNIYTSLDITIPETYAVKNHVHEQYATVDSVNAKADTEHNHDETYYKKSEVDDKLTALTKEVDDKIASQSRSLLNLSVIFLLALTARLKVLKKQQILLRLKNLLKMREHLSKD